MSNSNSEQNASLLARIEQLENQVKKNNRHNKNIAMAIWVIVGFGGFGFAAVALGYRFDGKTHQYVGIPDSVLLAASGLAASPALAGLVREYLDKD